MRWPAALGLALLAAPAAAAPPVTVLAAGDIAYCEYRPALQSPAAATAALVERELQADSGAAVLTLGDNVYQHGTVEEFGQCYGPTWGRFKDRTYPSPGNREYHFPGAPGYFAYFGRPPWYSFDLGAWHLVSLNSSVDGAQMQAQLDWLRADLAAHPARCTLAYWHEPLYSSGGHFSRGTMRAAWQLLYEAGADLVLSGHDHDYERFAPQDAHGQRDDARGLRQFVAGTGGAYLTPFIWFQPNSEVRDNSRTGVLRLRLRDDGFDWEFLQASYDGFAQFGRPDHGSARCHQQ
ncbi:MAG: metallophosphoesterase family protein [Telluria sp.]